jgi:branched-chain amino acid transport system ATP-binding protein
MHAGPAIPTSEAPVTTPSRSPDPAPTDQAGGLRVRGLTVAYGRVVTALRDVDMDVPARSIVAVMGVNGAGKSTLARTVSGLLRYHRGSVVGGTVGFDGADITTWSPRSIVKHGISQSLEGRRVFRDLSVADNLRVGGITRRRTPELRERQEWVLELFPRLAERSKQLAGYLSGGEQQMLALGRALMQSPRLLVLDEPSLGLAPRIVEQIAGTIGAIRETGTSVLLIEQNAAMALTVADHGYVLAGGRVVRSGPADELLADPDIQRFHLGLPGEDDEPAGPAGPVPGAADPGSRSAVTS